MKSSKIFLAILFNLITFNAFSAVSITNGLPKGGGTKPTGKMEAPAGTSIRNSSILQMQKMLNESQRSRYFNVGKDRAELVFHQLDIVTNKVELRKARAEELDPQIEELLKKSETTGKWEMTPEAQIFEEAMKAPKISPGSIQ